MLAAMTSAERRTRSDSAALRPAAARRLPATPWWARGPLRPLAEEVRERAARLPTRLNEFGYDPFGYDPGYGIALMLPMVWMYRHWLRVETRGIQNVPEGRVLLIGNHAGNTFAYDGAMLSLALFLEHEPPRIARGMAEYYLPTIPWFNVWMHRMGSVVGTPRNCVELLEHEEAVMVFPEGERGFVKTYRQAYELQRFGLGFMRLALETDTPIVPVGIVGSEEQSPGLLRSRTLGRLIGAPVAPVTWTMPWLGPLGFVPLPVKFRIHFGEPLRFEGDPNDEDALVEKRVEVVKDAIRALVRDALAERKGWFR
jgi:1-acyl-sn-glycerol-3-phosphate acyltransferase